MGDDSRRAQLLEVMDINGAAETLDGLPAGITRGRTGSTDKSHYQRLEASDQFRRLFLAEIAAGEF